MALYHYTNVAQVEPWISGLWEALEATSRGRGTPAAPAAALSQPEPEPEPRAEPEPEPEPEATPEATPEAEQ